MMTQDTIHIKSIKLTTTIGINPWEKAVKQTLFLDISFPLDAQKASQTDDITDTTDYDTLVNHIIKTASITQVNLIETLAERLATTCLTAFNLPEISLKLSKPHALGTRAGGVFIELTRQNPKKTP